MKTTVQPELSKELRELIDAALPRYIDFSVGCPARLREAIKYSLLSPGKRLRPHLVLLATEACGGDFQEAMPAAVAVEMIHAYSLVHDDLPAMDDDDLRRGRPTCHKQFDEATAILVGDALLSRAFEVLASDIQPPQRAAQCCAELARAAGATALVGGQADDLEYQHKDTEIRHGAIEQLESIHRRKTAALFRASLCLGALVADATEEQVKALGAFGGYLGLAFQVVDDLLDVAGNEAAVGKRVGKDQRAGKPTCPEVLGVDVSRLRAENLVESACRELECFGEASAPLRELAQFVLRRNF